MIWAFNVREAAAGLRFAERFHLAARRHELLMRPIGRWVYLTPPNVIDAALANWLARRVAATVDDTLAITASHADRAPEPPTARA